VCRHDEIGPDEAASRRQQPADQCRRDGERRIGDDAKRPAGESQVARICPNDDDAVRLEVIAQDRGAFVVQLDRHDAGAGADQCHREGAVAGADVKHELTGRDIRLLNEERRPSAIELVEPPPRLLPPGHGGP
jgi:hypothetical protein